MMTSTRKATSPFESQTATLTTTRFPLVFSASLNQTLPFLLLRLKIWRESGAAAASIDPIIWRHATSTDFRYQVWAYDAVTFGAGNPDGFDFNDLNTPDETGLITGGGTGLWIQVNPDVGGDVFSGYLRMDR